MRIVFAHPSYEYGSYHYYRKLVELSGFSVCSFQGMDLEQDDAVYIVSPACKELEVVLRQKASGKIRSKVIYWNLERPDVPTEEIQFLPGNAVHASTASVLKLPGVVGAWVSDRYQASLDSLHRFVVLGSDRRLGVYPLPPQLKKWHLCHYSYVYGRRVGPMAYFRHRNLSIAPEDVKPEDRNFDLSASQAIVSIHQTEAPVLEVLRSAWSAAYHLPLICEWVRDPWPLVRDRHFKAFETLDQVEGFLSCRELLEAVGERRWDLLCNQYNFASCVLAGVRETFR